MRCLPLFLLVIVFSGCHAEKPVQFEIFIPKTHEEIEPAVREAIKNQAGKFTEDDFKRVITLTIENNKISDFKFISKLTNLTYLSVLSIKNIDINFLKGLVNLRFLNLSNCDLEDITSLADMTNLKSLNLRNNQIVDLTPLSKLSNLKSLDHANNPINDFTPLKGLPNLQKLTLYKKSNLTKEKISQLHKLLPYCLITINSQNEVKAE